MKRVILCALLCAALLTSIAVMPASAGGSGYGIVGMWLGEPFDSYADGLGVRWIRTGMGWEETEIADNQYDDYILYLNDTMFNTMHNLGINVFHNFNYTPAWARSGPTGNYPPTNPATYTDYITFTVNRYKNTVKYWGLWNEPNLSMFYNGDFNWYINNLMIPGIDAIKAADPSAHVCIGELSTSGDDVGKLRTILQTVNAAGRKPLVDVICHHSYDGGDNWPGRVADIDTLHNMIVSEGWGSKDFWITESGMDVADQTFQANYVVGMVTAMDARPWWQKFFYWQLHEGVGDEFGLLDYPTWTPKQAYTQYQSYIAAHTGDQETYLNGGNSWSIPSTIQAENYDEGLDGASHHDTDINNEGTAFRTDGVDIESCSEGGYNVGWINTDEWLEYTISSPGGTFDITLRVASESGGGAYHIEVDSNHVTGTKTIPGTGGWQSWDNSTATGISIPAGTHIMRIYVESGGWNLNHLNITQNVPSQTPYAGVIQLPGTVEAENYDNGGEGVAYHDTASGNDWGQYRSNDVDIDQGGSNGYHLGNIATGEWLEYTVNVASAGQYDIVVRTSSDNPDGQFHVEMDGVNVTGTQSVPNTGWDNYTNVTVSNVSLNAGQQIMRVYADNGLWNFDYLTVAGAGAAPPSFVAAGAVASGTGAIAPALPTGRATNDILLLFLETANQAISITNQNGGTWAQVSGSPQYTGSGSSATRLTVFWSRYNGTQGAPTVSDSGDHQLGRIIAIRGATTSGNPWDVTAGGTEATSDTSGSIPGVTTTVANTLVVTALAASMPDATGTSQYSGWSNGNLTSLAERVDNTVTAGNGGGLAVATGVKATAGATGNTAVTLANSAAKAMMSIAIKP